MNRAIKEADQILNANPEFLRMPGGMIDIDNLTQTTESKGSKDLPPGHPALGNSAVCPWADQ